MSNKRLPAKFFQTETGKLPVREWLLGLEASERRAIGNDIKTVEFGWPVGIPTCRPLGKGLYEVRSNLPTDKIARVLFCIYEGQMILLHGFIKKTQKTPTEHLDKARQRKNKLEAQKDD